MRQATRRPWRPSLVGRSAERGELDRELARCVGGEFGSVLLIGESGVGKSRLAAEFVAEHADEVTVLRARAYHLGVTAAFGVWAEALDRELRTRTPEQVRRLCEGALEELAGLLRSVAALRTATPPHEPSRTRVLGGLAAVLSALAAERPVVVVVDDLHLADASSLEALHYLAHHCADAAVLVIGTARAVELADHPVAVEVLLRLEQDGLARRLPVRPLDQAALHDLAAEVLAGPPPATLVGWLAERSRGNPLDALGLLYALVEEGADLHHPALRRVPEALSDRVALRLRGLDPVAVEIVELLAVVGRRAELRGLVALSGRHPGELVDALAGLVRSRLVSEDEHGADLSYEITHPLVADAVYERIGAARRRVLHREAGRVLRSAGRLGEAAGHFVRSAGPDDGEAVTVLRDAVYAAEQAGAFEEALTVLAALVRLLPVGDPRWADVVDALSWDAQWVVDHRADSHAALGVQALRTMDDALAGLDDPGRRAPVKLRLASFLAWGNGELPEAERVCREAAALFEQAGDRRGALLAAHELAWVRGLSGDLAALEDGARAVAADAERVGDAMVRSRAVRTVGITALYRGRINEGEAAVAETIATAHATGDRYRLVMAMITQAMAAVLRGRVADGLATLDQMRAVEAELGVDNEVMVRWVAGDIAGVLARARRVAGIGPTPLSRRLGIGLGAVALAAAEVGELADARRYLGRLRALYTERGWMLHATMADWVEAMTSWREGRASEALPLLRRAVHVLLRGDWLIQAVAVLVDLAEIAGRAGAEERLAVDELRRVAERTGLGPYHALAALAAAWSALGGGDRAGAAPQAERAATALVGWPIYHARALYLVGCTTDDRERAVIALGESAALFERCGATLRRAEALDKLAALGSRGKRAAAAALGPSSLTGREREVAELAATGMSAREIGAALFIGERTVEGHLARAYARLGVRSKVELARRADEFGLCTPAGHSGTAARTATPDPASPRS